MHRKSIFACTRHLLHEHSYPSWSLSYHCARDVGNCAGSTHGQRLAGQDAHDDVDCLPEGLDRGEGGRDAHQHAVHGHQGGGSMQSASAVLWGGVHS